MLPMNGMRAGRRTAGEGVAGCVDMAGQVVQGTRLWRWFWARQKIDPEEKWVQIWGWNVTELGPTHNRSSYYTQELLHWVSQSAAETRDELNPAL